MNSVQLSGNLGADAELRFTKDGTPVTNFRLATHEFYKDAQGETRKRTEWHRVVIFGKTAENLAARLTKGRHVTVNGSLATHSWEDSQGVKRYQTQVRARGIELGALPQPKDEVAAEPATPEAVAEVIENLEK